MKGDCPQVPWSSSSGVVDMAKGCWQSLSTSSALQLQHLFILPLISFSTLCCTPVSSLTLAGCPRHCAQVLARRGGAQTKSTCQFSCNFASLIHSWKFIALLCTQVCTSKITLAFLHQAEPKSLWEAGEYCRGAGASVALVFGSGVICWMFMP